MKVPIRVSCSLQTRALKRPSSSFYRGLLKSFYNVEVVDYSVRGPQKFLTERRQVLGPNFAALGKVIIGQYSEVAKILEGLQQRGPYLGRFRCVEDRFSEYFLLFLSDQGAGGDGLHAKVREVLWKLVLGPGVERTSSAEVKALIQGLVDTARQKGDPPESDDVEDDVRRMVVRYVFLVFMETELTEEQVDSMMTLAFSAGPRKSLLTSRAEPFAPSPDHLDERDRMEAQMLGLIEQSPGMRDYEPSAESYDLDKRQLSVALLQAMAIAGCLGSASLAGSVLTKIPKEVEIDPGNAMQVRLAVLEAARRWAPVNNVNVVSREEITLEIAGKSQTFPPGTVLAASIGLASLDGSVFKDPLTFNPGRENLVSALLNFNSVGEEGRRECPGRGVAETMAADLLVAWRS